MTETYGKSQDFSQYQINKQTDKQESELILH